MRRFRLICRSAALLVGFACALMPAGAGWAQGASSPTLSLTPVASPVSTAGGCLKSSVGCQTWLNPSWTIAASDLRYQTSGGLNTSSTACFAVHTDLGSLSPFSGGGSGNDSPAPPQGAPAGGAWRTWCDNQLPLQVQGESQESIQIGSTTAGTATVTAYLLRYGQLGDGFTKAVIAQASLRLVFGSSSTPAPSPAPTPTVPPATASWPALPDALVSLASVSNGCGGGEASAESKLGDKSVYRNSNNPLGQRYVVNFRLACQVHDAGYSGAKVLDPFSGRVVDFYTWSQKQIDELFFENMRTICDQQVPADAPVALADCKATGGKTSLGAESRYNFVRSQGFRFYRGRPNLLGSWVNRAVPNSPKLLITQRLRAVTATWSGSAGQADFRGEFRGTLISRDQDSLVTGLARTSQGATTTGQAEMTFTVDPDKPNELVVTAGGTSEVLTR